MSAYFDRVCTRLYLHGHFTCDLKASCNSNIFSYRVFLAKQLKTLHSHLDSLIPTAKRAFLAQFYSQVCWRLLTVTGSFGSKTWTSLKTMFPFLYFRSSRFSSLFPTRKLLTDRQIPSFVNMHCILLPFSTSYFCSAAFKSLLLRLSVSE